MSFLSNLVLSVVIVAIFSSIILTIVGSDNSQRELVKISCGLLMIIVFLNNFSKLSTIDFYDFDNFHSEYLEISIDASTNYAQIEKNLIKSELENLVFTQTDALCEITLSDDFEILNVLIFNQDKSLDICTLLGIPFDKIEYIESR